jgi:hypothetical protein
VASLQVPFQLLRSSNSVHMIGLDREARRSSYHTRVQGRWARDHPRPAKSSVSLCQIRRLQKRFSTVTFSQATMLCAVAAVSIVALLSAAPPPPGPQPYVEIFPVITEAENFTVSHHFTVRKETPKSQCTSHQCNSCMSAACPCSVLAS